QQALEIYEQLAREHRDVWEYAYLTGRTRRGLVLDAQLAGRSDAALAEAGKAIEILEQVISRGHGQVRTDVLDVRVIRAMVLAGRGDYARAADEANVVA